MSKSVKQESAITQVLLRAGMPAFMTWLLIPLTFLIPVIDSTRAPYFDLTRSFAQLAYWLSESGGKHGAPIIAVLMLAILVNRTDLTSVNRWKKAGIVVVIAVICAGGGAALNEHILKVRLEVPRPNIVWLAGEDGSGPLGMTPQAFYQSGDREIRSTLLSKVFNHNPGPVPLSASIEAHWIEETGYSLPSGHAFSAMFFATFFLLLASTYLNTERRWLFYALLPWALAVCYSRPILRVHTPADITIGGFQGLVIGFIAWVVATALIRKYCQVSTTKE